MTQLYSKSFQWAVVGAGPAGMAAVGKLLDNNIAADAILWLDPQFKVGDLGQFWSNVSSNTTVKRFNDFLEAADSFAYPKAADDFELSRLPPQNTCQLSQVVEPLQWISNHLIHTVCAEKAWIEKIWLSERHWHLQSLSTVYLAQNVILATGARAIDLDYPDLQTIPFELAIDKEKLMKVIDKNETFAVFGSSHSAVIVLRHLVEAGVKKVINFYRSPCRYAIDMGEWILFDNTGLKGDTATWARNHLDGHLPANLVRYTAHDYNRAQFLPECDQAIYAVGFEPRDSLIIGDYGHLKHNPNNGIIAPGLFGFGIAWPEMKADPFGTFESQVGLWKFMLYLNKVLPVWLNYPC